MIAENQLYDLLLVHSIAPLQEIAKQIFHLLIRLRFLKRLLKIATLLDRGEKIGELLFQCIG